MDNNGFEDAILVRNQALSEVPNTKDKLPYESDEDFKIRQEILTDVPLPAGLANMEQPVNLEELFHELNALSWSLTDSCSELDELIQVLQEKRAEKEAEYIPKMQEIEGKIKAEMLTRQKSFKCDWGKATYSKGRTTISWNDEALKGYAVTHEDILQFRTEKTGSPSVSLKVGYQA